MRDSTIGSKLGYGRGVQRGLILLAASVLLAVLVACAGGATTAPAPGADTAAAPAAAPAAPERSSMQTIQPETVQAPEQSDAMMSKMEPQYGGIMQSVSKRMPSCLYFLGDACVSGGLKTTILPLWEGLIDYEYVEPGLPTRGASKYSPLLAESWTLVDPRTYDFTLRQGVKWHDGTVFTSKDVIWSLNQWADPTSHGSLQTVFKTFEKVEATGEYGIRITLKEPSPYFFGTITYINPRIMAAHIAEEAGNPTGEALIDAYDSVDKAIGTGPFKLKSYDKTAAVELVRNDDYWGGRPYLDGMRILYVKDISAWQAAFATSKIDYVTLDDRVQADTLLKNNPDATALSYHITSVAPASFNITAEPFNDVRVRRAINLALDRQGINASAMFGDGYTTLVPLAAGLTQTGWGVPQEEYLQWPGFRQPKDQDIAEAKRLLADAGIPEGYEIILKHDRGSSGPSTLAEPVAGQLRTIGLNVKVQPLEPATYLSEVERERDFGMIVGGAGASDTPSLGMADYWHSTGPSNIYGVNDPQLDQFIEAALVELDDDKRSELYGRVQRHIYDNVYSISLPVLAKFQLWQPWLHEFYGTFSSNPSHFNSAAYWLEVDKMPAERRSW